MDQPLPTDLSAFLHLGVALAIGLLVGLERGWRGRDLEEHGRAAGFRTYGLAGLLGGISGSLAGVAGGVVLAASLLAFAAAFTLFHWREAERYQAVSVTSVIAGLATFGLGALAVIGPVELAIAGAVAMTVLLSLRETLHGWVARLTWEELRAVLTLLVMTFLLLPILPDRPIDPWQALIPREIWLYAILMTSLSFAGYVAVRLMDPRLGILVTAAAGGLASSTATTLTFSRLAAGPRLPRNTVSVLAAGVLVSSSVMLARVGVVTSLLNPAIFATILLPLMAGIVSMLAGAAALIFLRAGDTPDAPDLGITIDNPLAIGSSLRLTAFIAAVTLAARIVKDAFGESGLYSVAAVSGLADVDAITISLSRLETDTAIAATGILIAVAVNTASKAVMSVIVGGLPIGLRVGVVSTLAIGAGLLVLA
ncbi:MAG: MgtC/SapB family protein [Rubellimicrobium sp.]|nr:MgtC/SapB family protein [Rubellimicrobium sp.]